jgi:hypothetical protein
MGNMISNKRPDGQRVSDNFAQPAAEHRRRTSIAASISSNCCFGTFAAGANDGAQR